ncbi:MAG TPA: hypothetical protein VJ824_15935 [Bacillota bacterium]|nr:hypothetical protein [Bacillota bacterium]
MGKKRIFLILGVALVGIIGIWSWKSSLDKNQHLSSQVQTASSPASGIEKNSKTTEPAPVNSVSTPESKDTDLGFSLSYEGKGTKLKDLKPAEQRAVLFLKDYINTQKNETKEEQFQRMKPKYYQPGSTGPADLMGSKLLPPFQPGRQLEAVAIIKTLEEMYKVPNFETRKDEQKPGYTIFTRVFFNHDSMDIPVKIDPYDYVLGYDDRFRGKVLDHPQN